MIGLVLAVRVKVDKQSTCNDHGILCNCQIAVCHHTLRACEGDIMKLGRTS